MKSPFMSFYDLIHHCKSNYGFDYTICNEIYNVDELKIIASIRDHLLQYNKSLIVHVSSDEIRYQICEKF